MNSLVDRPYIILGAGGHGAVVGDLIMVAGGAVTGVTDDAFQDPTRWFQGIPMLGDDSVVLQFEPNSVYLALGVGSIAMRQKLYVDFTEKGYFFPPLVHPSAVVASSVGLGNGVQVMAGAVVQARTLLGNGVIVNTKASVDHDCVVGDFSHIAPGSTLCGTVTLGERVHVGAGTVVIQEISVAADNFIKACVCVKRNLV